MADTLISRRSFLASACCAAAAPVFTPVSLMAMPGERRFVTIVLRGAMDGLDLLQPYDDPAFAKLRPKLALTPDKGLFDLDGRFGLHPAAADLMPLWKARDIAFVHSVSTPYRDQRSHFDGQDILESGGGHVREQQSGWLNRTLAAIPRTASRRAIDINTSTELILSGSEAVDVWSADSNFGSMREEADFLARLYQNDSDFAAALAEATRADGKASRGMVDAEKRTTAADVARVAAQMLKADYRVASFSITGWDTHVGQIQGFARPAKELASAIIALKSGLGPEIWNQTIVLAMTEFGRTVRQNGSGGTDHGTGGVALVAGGDIRGGRVLGRWSGLSDDKLLDQRDLMPTGDIRELAAAMISRQFDITPDKLTNTVFPGLSFDRSSDYLRLL
ncbi:DUF1501 domain-containing protein [Pararhizobium arenae]|uniref:DUF1501 domain-containing protein n=1 Tax=Pararhizobium arenae TaxID=1856850 RepID=UPI00094B0C08|nr:DUF1501 domain-containing protein [Pararhizobium arenae]